MVSRNVLIVSLLCAVLVSCKKEDPKVASAGTVVANLAFSNIDSSRFPWAAKMGDGMTKRWELPIPVKTNGEVRAAAAMDAIEQRLGKIIFDRTSIESADEAAITRGIVLRKGTAYVPREETNLNAYCANVSGAPLRGDYPEAFYDGATGVISTRLYVNLDNRACTAKPDVVIHEFGHALGLGAHFDGFGNGDSISDAFWAALITLYANPPGTRRGDVALAR